MEEVVLRDLEYRNFTNEDKTQIIGVIEQMSTIHDKNNDGFDFVELYTASGGKLQDL